MHLRASLGTAILLGLERGRMDAPPTTLYLMLGGECRLDCQYCMQARGAPRSDLLSRVVWPPFPLERVLGALAACEGVAERICIQMLSYPGMRDDLIELVLSLRAASGLPISVSVAPMPREGLEALREAGVSRVGISIDEASDVLFDAVRPGFGSPGGHWRALGDAMDVFGAATLHLIVGVGETDAEVIGAAARALAMRSEVALFAFTRLDDRLPFQRPTMARYRSMQVAVQLLREGVRFGSFTFDVCGTLTGIPQTPRGTSAIMTAGCPGCNRPCYNESPGGPLYNVPREPTEAEVSAARADIMSYGVAIGRGPVGKAQQARAGRDDGRHGA
ncbi:MAG: radical SAM protein [Thermoplasmata archaeon]|nr:radical SAM protein [Thermoplasmata archaeon]